MDLTQVIQKIIEVTSSSTDLLLQEITQYILVMSGLRIALTFVVVSFIAKGVMSGITYLKSYTDTLMRAIYVGTLRALLACLLLGSLLWSYKDLDQLVKVIAAPHIYALGELHKLLDKGKGATP